MDLIRASVSKDKPNLLPHVRVRDNPHVSSEEWEWLQESGVAHRPDPDPESDVTVTSDSVGGKFVVPFMTAFSDELHCPVDKHRRSIVQLM